MPQHSEYQHSNGPTRFLEIVTDLPSKAFKTFSRKVLSGKILFHHTKTKYLQTPTIGKDLPSNCQLTELAL